MKSENLAEFKSGLVTPLVDVKSQYQVECLWFYNLQVTADEIWPYLADTSRMNRDLGLTAWKETTVGGELHVEASSLGRVQRWVEKPWIWKQPHEIQNHRVFSQGWMTEQRGVFKVYPETEGCRVAVYFQWGFKSIFSKWLFLLASNILHKKFADFFKKTENSIVAFKNSKSGKVKPSFALSEEKQKAAQEKINKIKHDFEVDKSWNDLKNQILTYFLTEDEMNLDKVHPKKVASQIDVTLPQFLGEARDLLRKGFLYLAWEVVCPHCRGAVASEKYLSAISNKNQCESCDIEFSLEQEESVEVVFHLTSKLRDIQVQQYCAAEPAKKKHIKLCQQLAGGEHRQFGMKLPEGRYRLRGGLLPELSFVVDRTIAISELIWPLNESVDEVKVNPQFNLVATNGSSNAIELILEESWWLKDKLLPGEVLSLPQFRDLFSQDYLASGVKLYLGQQVLLFTDIVGSTPLYRELGDAKAFEAVRKHYEEIEKIVISNNGVLVKFIGDAVMAAYLDLQDAVRSAISIQNTFAAVEKPIKLRVSLNHGPVLCANLNVGLDYFGTTVNNAAKIQKWAKENQIAMTQEIWTQMEGEFQHKIRGIEALYDEKLDLNVVVISI